MKNGEKNENINEREDTKENMNRSSRARMMIILTDSNFKTASQGYTGI